MGKIVQKSVKRQLKIDHESIENNLKIDQKIDQKSIKNQSKNQSKIDQKSTKNQSKSKPRGGLGGFWLPGASWETSGAIFMRFGCQHRANLGPKMAPSWTPNR